MHKLPVTPAAIISAILCLLTLPAPTNAAGRVYSREKLPVCRLLAQIKGVYAVYSRHDPAARTRTYDIVLSPGAKAANVAPQACSLLSAQSGDRWITSVNANIYTYHDPGHTVDFRRTFSANEFFTCVYGFPDHRASLAAIASLSYNPVTGAPLGTWTTRTVYSDPALFRTGD